MRHRLAIRAAAVSTVLCLAALLGARALLAAGPAQPVAAALAAPVAEPASSRERGRVHHGERKLPSAAGVRSAWRYARRRGGSVSFAVVDTEGELRGRTERRRYPAASVVKSMVLAAELRRLKQADEDIDDETGALLSAMITSSDNEAADAIYDRVGDAGLFAVAKRARMTRFRVAGYWGNAQIAAADMALFFGDLDRMLVRRYREYGKGLLGSIIESQRWGIPAAAADRWAVRFKGGWLPDHALAHQAAELRERDGDRVLSMAILTDSQPSHVYATETVRGVAERLLSRDGGA